MYTYSKKTWFKAIALVVIQAFLLTQSNIAWAAGPYAQATDWKRLKEESNKDKEAKKADEQMVRMFVPGAMPKDGVGALGAFGKDKDSAPQEMFGDTVRGLMLAGSELSTTFALLKKQGATISQAVFAALRQEEVSSKFSLGEIYEALIKAGYDSEDVHGMLGELAKIRHEKKTDAARTGKGRKRSPSSRRHRNRKRRK